MAAAQIAIDEQLRNEIEKPETLRERVARHLVGDSTPSNFERMCDIIARDPNAGPEPCEACGGTGSRQLPPAVVADYLERIRARLHECEQLKLQLAEVAPDAREGSYEWQRLAMRLRDTGENVVKLRREMNRRSICRTCRGSTYAPRRRGTDKQKPDSLFTTVACERCRGLDGRQHPKLMTQHRGAGSGLALHRDEATGRRYYAACLACMPEGEQQENAKGRGYVIPVSARPALKTSNVHEDPNGVDDFRDGFPTSDFEDDDEDDLDPEAFLERTRKQDPLLAAAIAALLGPQGDEWAQHAWGRRFSLWPLTEAGRRLAEASKHETRQRTPYERALMRCAKERFDEVQSGCSNDRRRALLGVADTEARKLERRVELRLREP